MEENAKQIRNHYKKEVEKVIILEEQPDPKPRTTIPLAEHRQAIRDLKTMNDTYWQKECLRAQKRGVIEGLRLARTLVMDADAAFGIDRKMKKLQEDPDLVVKEENEQEEDGNNINA